VVRWSCFFFACDYDEASPALLRPWHPSHPSHPSSFDCDFVSALRETSLQLDAGCCTLVLFQNRGPSAGVAVAVAVGVAAGVGGRRCQPLVVVAFMVTAKK